MRKVFLIIVIGFLVLGAGIAYFGPAWAESKIEQKINSISFLSYDSLSINVSDRSLKFFNLKGNQAGYEGVIEELEIQGLQLIPIFLDQKFVVKNVLAKGVNIAYQLNQNKKKQINDSSKSKNEIPSFEIESIDLVGGFFTISNDDDNVIFSSKIEASLNDLSDGNIVKPRTLPMKLGHLELDSSRCFTKDGLYNITVSKTLYYNELLSVTDIELVSSKGKFDLGKYVGHEIEWFSATVDSIKMRIPSLESFLGRPKVQKMKIYQPNILAFRDKRLPFPENQRPPLVRDLLMNKDLVFAFDSISIIGGNVTYEVFVKEEKGPGEISFKDLNAHITGLSSYSLGLKKKPRLIANCKLYGKSNLYTDISFPDSPASSNTWVKGKLLNTDLTLFNRMIQYVSVVEIKSGKSDFLEFDFIHNDTIASGEMKFAYTDLVISFLDKQEAEPEGFMNIVKSLFVNTFVIDRNNNFETDKFRIGKIDFERDKEKSIFNFWSGSILTGFKSSTGVDATGEKIDNN